MRWFQGTISEAISEAKLKKAVFVVFVSGDDERSVNMNRTFENDEVSNQLERAGCVAVKLQGNSEVCRQFSQIYPVVLIPSTYFIGHNGMPLEIIGGDVSPGEFLKKIETVLQHGSVEVDITAKTQSSDTDVKDDVKDDAKDEPEPQSPNRELSSPSLERVENPTTSNENVPVTRSPTPESGPTVDDKVERAKLLIMQQKEQKAKLELEEEKRKEMERRKMGQEVRKLKTRQKDAETKQLVDDLAKERAEEKAARERIRDQIAKDRAERAAKYQAEKIEQERAKQEAQNVALQLQQERSLVDAAERSNFARLQFRFPDGSSTTHQFPSETTLNDVRRHIEDSSSFNMSAFTLSTTFPRREFTDVDNDQTLRQLRLAPCAAMLVVPIRVQHSSVSVPGGAYNIFWTLLGPLVALFNYLRVLFFGARGPPSPPKGNTNPRRRSHAGGNDTPNPNANKRLAAESETKFGRQEGNVRRLRNNDEDDDENNTWNGNSTQLM